MPDSGEEQLRRLQAETEGADPDPDLHFLGERYQLRPQAGLVALLRYAWLMSLLREEEPDDRVGQQILVATHKLLSESIDGEQWAAFQNAAIAGKASQKQVDEAVRRIIEIYTARKPWTGIRLLGYAAGNLAELDGQLLRGGTGLGLTSLTARQLCNIIYSAKLDQLEEEQRNDFIDDLKSEQTADQRALQRALDAKRQREGSEPVAPAQPPPPPRPAGRSVPVPDGVPVGVDTKGRRIIGGLPEQMLDDPDGTFEVTFDDEAK